MADHTKDVESSETDETLTPAEIERLGRQRPDVFKSALSEWLFVFSVVASLLMSEYLVSGFNLVQPTVAAALDIPESALTWPTSVFSLIVGAFLLPVGRLADMYGAYYLYMIGMVWFLLWSFVAGFSQNYEMLIATRVLGGFGPAAFLPASMALMGKTYRPGPRKNLVFGIHGAVSPLGFFFGILLGGVTGQCMTWRWYFWLGSIVLAVACVTAFFSIPNDRHEERPKGLSMDYWGTATVVPALVLIVFALTEGSHAPDGWRTPYILATFIPGVLLLAAFIYIEGWVAACPLLPFDLFKPKHMGKMVISLFFAYGTFGVFLFYASYHIQTVMNIPPLLTAMWFAPMAVGGIVIALVGGFTLHILPGRILFIISGLGHLASALLFALIPDGANFWAFIFPAMIAATIGIDITWNVSNVQGVAGAVICSLLFLGISFFLGIADLVVGEVKNHGQDNSEKVAFYVATATAGISLILFAFIDVGKATSQRQRAEAAR
ncbi:MFS general substrate transporter [Thozetella sp. PMI_491]|nr:MFS general substrate transporter [Thozetella sp. PMI_491]